MTTLNELEKLPDTMRAGNFKVEIGYNKDNKDIVLDLLGTCVSSWAQQLNLDSDPEFLDNDYEDEDDDEEEVEEDLPDPYSDSTLELTVLMSLPVLQQIKELEKSDDIKATITYLSSQGDPIFYHSFQCEGALLNQDHGVTEDLSACTPLTLVLGLFCYKVEKFIIPSAAGCTTH